MDENISKPTVNALRALGHDVKTVYEAGLAATEDDELIELAIGENRVVITLDLDFGETYYLSRRGSLESLLCEFVRPP